MLNEKRTHIVKRGSGWAVKKEGTHRATRIYESIELAIQYAQKEIEAGSDLIIHKTDGSIDQWLVAKR
ncbi:DUF2188 domain-containing protein [Flavobacterium sp.]|uniref:DUF2188 domain-containing protein n=1 Tax=Flavobacterium sp. TaxID=239 RepID=UPI0039E22734